MSDPTGLLVERLDIWTGAVERKNGAGRGNGGKFSLYGIEKLRSLILNLAVRGKLVPQVPEDEPASALLKRLLKKRPTYVDLGFIRRNSVAESMNGAAPFSIPETWVWVRLDQIGAVVGGGTPSASNHTNFTQPGDGIPWLTPADLGGYSEMFISRGARDLTEKGLADGSAKLMPEGTVLFTSRAPIGYVAIASNPISTNQGFKSIVPFDPACSRYIALAMRTFADEIDAKAPGTTFKEVSGKIVAAIPFPLPPLAEQKRIVAKVDELMALCDALEAGTREGMAAHEKLVRELLATLVNSTDADDLAANWSGIEAHFDTLFTTEESIEALKRTIVDLAVRGKLVRQDTNDEPASRLLTRIGAARASLVSTGKMRRQPELPPLTADECLFSIPDNWVATRLQSVIDVRDGTHDSPKDASGVDTYPLVTSKDFKDGKIIFETARRISAEDHNEIAQRSLVERDDILFSMIGGNIGNQVQVDTDEPFSIKNVALFKYYSKDLTDPSFVKLFTENLATRLQAEASGGAQPFVSLGYFRKLFFALPPIAEQKRISRRVAELMEVTTALTACMRDGDLIKAYLAEAASEKVAA